MKARFCRLLSTMQSRLDAFFAPPAAVRGMRQLDRVAFRREVTLPAVFLQEPSLCSKFLRRLQHAVLRYPRIRRVQERQAGGGKVGHFENTVASLLSSIFLWGGLPLSFRFQCTHMGGC